MPILSDETYSLKIVCHKIRQDRKVIKISIHQTHQDTNLTKPNIKPTTTMCTKTRTTNKASSNTTSNASANSALHSFLHNLIREKSHQSGEGTPLDIRILPDDAAGSEGGILRKQYSRIGRSKSDPFPCYSLKPRRPSVLDVSDHTKGVSRWLSTMPQSPSQKKKQVLSTYMLRQPMRIPSVRRMNAAKSA